MCTAIPGTELHTTRWATLAGILNGDPLRVFLFARLWTVVWASLALGLVPIRSLGSRLYYGMTPLDDQIGGWLLAPWQRWDSIWYARIATHGYSAGDLSTAFFPLYPFLIRVCMAVLPIDAIAAGLVISSLAALGAFILFYEWTREAYDVHVARRALMGFAVFPTAFFLLAAYPESLFLYLALAAWRCGSHGHWGRAGLLGALAALARAQGLLLVLPLAVMFICQYRRGQVSLARVALLFPVVGAGAAFMGYLFQLTGSVGAWLQVEAEWRQSAMPWQPLVESMRIIITGGDPGLGLLNLLDLGLTLVFLGVIVWLAQRRQFAEALYVATIVIPPLFAIARFDSALPLASMSRFLLLAFPAFALLGTIRLRRPGRALVGILALSLQVLLIFLFTHWIFAG